MKRLLLILSVMICCLVMSGCGSATEGKNFDTIAGNFTDAIYSRDYEEAMSYVNEEYKDTLNEEAMGNIVATTVGEYGLYQGVTSCEMVSVDEFITNLSLEAVYDPKTFNNIVYFETISLDNGEMGMYFLFDKSDRSICGVILCGDKEYKG